MDQPTLIQIFGGLGCKIYGLNKIGQLGPIRFDPCPMWVRPKLAPISPKSLFNFFM